MKILLNPRGTTGQNDIYVGGPGQITVDTDRWELRLHDDETAGGHRILNLAQLIQLFMSKDSEFGAVAFAPSDRGYLVRTGDKQYSMRSIEGTGGIAVANPEATEGNTEISIDEDYLNQLLLQGIAGRIAWGEITTGTGAAYAVTLPEFWPNTEGAIAAFKFHVAGAANATLTVSTATTPDPTSLPTLPLKSAGGSVLTAEMIRAGMLGFIMRVDDEYRLVGVMHPAEQGITPIAGLAATTVQAALAELQAAIGGIAPNPTTGVFYTFTNPGQVQSTSGSMGTIPLADGEFRYVSCTAQGGSRQTGGSGGGQQAYNGIVEFNGVSLQGWITNPGNAVAPRGFSKAFKGIVHRSGTEIYMSELSPSVEVDEDSVLFYGTAFRVGSVAEAATTVNTQVTSQYGAGRWTYSDAGVIAT